ncbi:hypothetical protein TD95_001780 [Thielaviopsis punctulata]|uniref:Deacetylase sirtuin-type domain-containing protein n=1 Tax=Thielaviopsis punctulata TaxID=72032 RepID=A0A0F4ZML4_9PEZI|nr:hypothetical protein TD95_001780 [Thielaviopsis punctulata]
MPTVEVSPDNTTGLQDVANALLKAKRIVVVTGAGISTNSGIPDFRSENGLYSLIQAQFDAATREESKTDDFPNTQPRKRQRLSDCGSSSRLNSNRTSLEPERESPVTSECASASRQKSPAEAAGEKPAPITPNPKKGGPLARVSLGALSLMSSPLSSPPTGAWDHYEDFTELELHEAEDQEAAHQYSQALSRTLPNIKGKDLFDAQIWSDPLRTSVFYTFATTLRQKVRDARPTPSHHFISHLRDRGKLVRCYTQNIDMIEEKVGLTTELSLGPGSRSRFTRKSTLQRAESMAMQPSNDSNEYEGEQQVSMSQPAPALSRVQSNGPTEEAECVDGDDSDKAKTSNRQFPTPGVECVYLHGSLQYLRCFLCGKVCEWDSMEANTIAGEQPDCPHCTGATEARLEQGKRPLGIGKLRPDIVLYGEEHPHSHMISPIVTSDLGVAPDMMVIMGTSLRVHGLKVMVREFAKAVHNKGGHVIFVNFTKPPESIWGDIIDYWVSWDCDTWVGDMKERIPLLWVPVGEEEEWKRKQREATKAAVLEAKAAEREAKAEAKAADKEAKAEAKAAARALEKAAREEAKASEKEAKLKAKEAEKKAKEDAKAALKAAALEAKAVKQHKLAKSAETGTTKIIQGARDVSMADSTAKDATPSADTSAMSLDTPGASKNAATFETTTDFKPSDDQAPKPKRKHSKRKPLPDGPISRVSDMPCISAAKSSSLPGTSEPSATATKASTHHRAGASLRSNNKTEEATDAAEEASDFSFVDSSTLTIAPVFQPEISVPPCLDVSHRPLPLSEVYGIENRGLPNTFENNKKSLDENSIAKPAVGLAPAVEPSALINPRNPRSRKRKMQDPEATESRQNSAGSSQITKGTPVSTLGPHEVASNMTPRQRLSGAFGFGIGMSPSHRIGPSPGSQASSWKPDPFFFQDSLVSSMNVRRPSVSRIRRESIDVMLNVHPPRRILQDCFQDIRPTIEKDEMEDEYDKQNEPELPAPTAQKETDSQSWGPEDQLNLESEAGEPFEDKQTDSERLSELTSDMINSDGVLSGSVPEEPQRLWPQQCTKEPGKRKQSAASLAREKLPPPLMTRSRAKAKANESKRVLRSQGGQI